MKNLILAGFLLCFIGVGAQQTNDGKASFKKERHEKMTPQQRAALSTKRMTLALDLSEAQQSEILKIELEQAEKREKAREERKSSKENGTDSHFEHRMQRLDDKIAYKAKIKAVLTEGQFQQWEKRPHRKHMGTRHTPQTHNKSEKKH